MIGWFHLRHLRRRAQEIVPVRHDIATSSVEPDGSALSFLTATSRVKVQIEIARRELGQVAETTGDPETREYARAVRSGLGKVSNEIEALVALSSPPALRADALRALLARPPYCCRVCPPTYLGGHDCTCLGYEKCQTEAPRGY
jgi:hypothetical protein